MPLLTDRRNISVCSGCGGLIGPDHLPHGGSEEGVITFFDINGTVKVQTIDEDYCTECMAQKREYIQGGVEAARRRLHDHPGGQ